MALGHKPPDDAAKPLDEIDRLAAQLMAPGTMIDHFRVMRRLGHGGMGEVHLARDTKLGRKVALKLVHPEQFDSPETLSRFVVEARITARFSHPHIVTLYEVGEYQGRPYLALEYVEGEDLAARMVDRRLSAREAERIGLAVAEALAEAHRHGVLHRDLKPGNVLIGRDGRVRVLDFGLAKSFDLDGRVSLAPDTPRAFDALDPPSSRLPMTGAERSWGVGTPKYMAPEQWRDERCSSATDLWSFGVLMYAMLAHRLPFDEQVLADQAYAVCTEPHAPIATLAQVPEEFAALLERCLAKAAGERPTASEAVAVLSRLVHHRGRARPQDEDSPFRGLMPFTERHAHLYFGRDAEIDAFVERLRTTPVLVVLGPSGAGKSSFVRAGVVPRLREQEPWTLVNLRPGARPLMALAAGLRIDQHSTTRSSTRKLDDEVTATELVDDPTTVDVTGPPAGRPRPEDPSLLAERLRDQPRLLGFELRALAEERGGKVLLLADQLEEVLTLAADEGEARAFLEAVRCATDDAFDPVRVVITLRDDYLGRLATSPEIRELLSQVTVMQRPDGGALREILLRPVQELGYAYEDDALVDEMVADVGGEPACLPILQFACSRLWDQRDSRRRLLLRSAYTMMGGVAGALAKHGDSVLAGLSDSELATARELLLRMVTPDGTRRVVPERDALEGLGEAASSVLVRLTEARLVSVSKIASAGGSARMLDLAHESLVGSWATLRRWVEESREDLAFVAEIGQAAALWDRRGRRDEELWQGDALRECQKAMARMTTGVPELVRAFVTAAERRERYRTRRRRAAYAGLVLVLALAATGAALVALFVRRQRDMAEIERARALRDGARAAFEQGRLLEARAKLRQALERDDSAIARALWWQLRDEPLAWRESLGSSCYAVTLSDDGKLLAAATQDGPVYLLDSATAAVRVLRGHRDQAIGVALSPDGKRLASSSLDGTVRIWNVDTASHVRTLQGPDNGLHGVAFSPDGKRLAAGGYDHHVHLWDVAGGERIATLRGHQAAVRGVAFSPDGKRLASAGADRVVRLWDVSAASVQAVLSGHEREAFGVAFSADGDKLASSSYDGSVRLWNARSGALLRTLQHGAGVSHVAFDPQSAHVAGAGADGQLIVWDAQSGAVSARYRHDAQVFGVAFAADGNSFATSTSGRQISLYRRGREAPPRPAEGHGSYVSGVAFSSDGKQLASAGHDKLVRLWDVASGDPAGELSGHSDGVGDVLYTPDGRWVVAGGKDGTIRMWDARTGAPGLVLTGHRADIFNLAVSHDGALLASGSYDQTARIWRLRDGASLQVLDGHNDRVRGVSFSPDAARLATGGYDGTVRIWDVATGGLIQAMSGHEHRVYGVAFNSDGSKLASASYDRSLRLWDVDAGEGRIVGRCTGRIYNISFHPAGSIVGAPCSDGSARLWNVDDASYTVLSGHQNEVNTLRFSPDGRLAATSSDDGTVRLWDVASAKPAWRAPALIRHGGGVHLSTHLGWSDLAGGAPTEADWAALADKAIHVHQSPDASLICLRTETAASLHRLIDPSPLASLDSPVHTIAAADSGCVALGEAAHWLDERGAHRIDLAGCHPPACATVAAAVSGSRVAVIAGDHAYLVEAGAVTTRRAVGTGATALAMDGDELLVGYADGSVELMSGGAARFEQTPASRVVQLALGPSGTVAVGFAGGQLGLWDRKTGSRLASARLHGSMAHLMVADGALYAATDLGRHLRWDLAAFTLPHCELLAELWADVPVTWQDGHARQTPPPRHRCR